MTEVNMQEKYLAQMLEGAEQGIEQMTTALQQIEAQRDNVIKRKTELEKVAADLKQILGLQGEPSFWQNDSTL